MKRREWAKNIRELPTNERFEYDQFLLWHKLHKAFTQIEYVSYDDLPEALKAHVQHFPEFVMGRTVAYSTPNVASVPPQTAPPSNQD